jgi:hypothetical protein
MRKTLRLGLLGVACAAALTFASVALGAYSPTLNVTRRLDVGTGAVVTDVTVAQTQADDPSARITLYAPTGFSATLSQAVGTQIGTVEGQVFAADISSVVPVTGTIAVADKSSAQLMAAATVCTGTATHDAIWIITVSAAGSSLQIPAYVDQLSGVPFASARISFCLLHPSAVVFKIRLLNATLHLTNVFAPPAAPGAYRWTMVATPWDPATPALNAAGTIEAQAIDRTPVSASLSVKRLTKTKRVKHKGHTDIRYSYSARLTGQARAGGGVAEGVTVDIFAGTKKVTTATTNSNGSFSVTLKLAKTTSYHAVFSKAAGPSSGGTCQPNLTFPGTSVPIPCGTVTEGGFTAASQTVTLKKPKLTVKHLKPKKKGKK